VHRDQLERELERLHADSWGWALACVQRDRELAEDVLQIAYVKMLSGAASPSGGSSVRTWAFGVIRLTALEEQRRRRRADGRFDNGSGYMEAADPAPGPDVLTERAERASVLTAALATISDRQREALQLVFYHGMTIEEAAHVMRVSLGSARTHYKRGKAALAVAIAHLREDVR
jgi:RNA polymerase sigma factor (sigma-70 family)